MPKFFVTQEQVKNDTIEIVGKDVNHIKNVLRQKIGDKITICNNDTLQDYECEISKIEENKIYCDIKETLNTSSESNVKVTIFQGLPKADKMELVIQKSVELGVFDITPVEMKRCVVKLKENDKKKKIERWHKIAEVAAKQSGRNQIPKINDIIQIKNICQEMEKYDIVLVAYEKEENNTLKQVLKQLKEREYSNLKIGVVIGPEGGIEQQEIEMLKENGAEIITLGKRILRTETVALNVLSILMYELEE